jgi:integrase
MMSLPGVRNWWVRCLERAGVPHFPMHELRHSAIDELNRQTGDVVAASQLAGHASVATTQTYLHPTQDDLIARMRQVEW